MILFFIGIVEMLIASFWTKMVSDTKVMGSGAITIVNVLIWYYVLESVLQDLGNWEVVLIYAVGCAVGTMLSTWIFQVIKKRKRLAKKLAKEANLKKIDI